MFVLRFKKNCINRVFMLARRAINVGPSETVAARCYHSPSRSHVSYGIAGRRGNGEDGNEGEKEGKMETEKSERENTIKKMNGMRT
jgi:hypothetical protein